MRIDTTREQRRELARLNAKLPKTLQLVARTEWPLHLQSSPVARLWRSQDFLVQEYVEPPPLRRGSSDDLL